jgi:hypothetical protein
VEPADKPLSPEMVRANRVKFIFIVALFVLPISLAMYLHFSGWRPGSTMNHGSLVQPARPAPEMRLQAIGSPGGGKSVFDGKWNLVVVSPGNCNEACLNNLYSIRQIHIGQGKHQQRVRRILIVGDKADRLDGILTSYPELTVDTLEEWLSFGDTAVPLDSNRVYMVDPLGNYMMYYAPGFEAAGIRRDLARLLRVSRIG